MTTRQLWFPAAVMVAGIALVPLLRDDVPAQPMCGNGIIDPGEDCDPPGSITCPAGSPAGAFLPCPADCTCAPPFVLDHFKCYRTVGQIAQRSVSLTDQFGPSTATVLRPSRLCNPADKNGGGINDLTAHLMCYKLRPAPFARRDVLVRNQFGDQTLTVVKPETLCNPAEKDGVPLSSAAGAFLNHFKCYKVRGKGFTARSVTLTDQFETRTTTIVKPLLLCNPVDKNGEGVPQPASHLTCYKIKDAPGFAPRSVMVEDQFTDQDLQAIQGSCRKAALLCVPSEKNPQAPSTTTTTSTSSTSSLIPSTSTAPPTTSTSTSSTTSTTVRETLCCEVPTGSPSLPTLCFDAVSPDVDIKCQLLGGLLVPGVCDPVSERCVPPQQPVPPNDFCCECPVPMPPFPHPQFCFEGVIGHEAKCQPPCVLIPATACGPVSERCGGSPSGAFLDPIL